MVREAMRRVSMAQNQGVNVRVWPWFVSHEPPDKLNLPF
jgi:hypothetical protein